MLKDVINTLTVLTISEAFLFSLIALRGRSKRKKKKRKKKKRKRDVSKDFKSTYVTALYSEYIIEYIIRTADVL